MQTDTKELTTTKIPSSALNKAAYIAFLLVGIFYLVKRFFKCCYLLGHRFGVRPF